MSVSLTPKLREEYQRLFDTCMIRQGKAKLVETIISQVEPNRNLYALVGDPLGIPWYVVGVIHNMEASLNFKTHLHNGDPLTERTIHVPVGRPKTGNPPFTWEFSATDALQFDNFHKWTDWSIPGILYKLECYNGLGYRTKHPEVLSPYLWSFSNHYTCGKFVADGRWSSTAVSQQCGAAILLRRMAETGIIRFNIDGMPLSAVVSDTAEFGPLVQFSTTKKSHLAEELQKSLNNFPGIFVKVDGIPSEKTSDAFKKVTGHFLVGDPRA